MKESMHFWLPIDFSLFSLLPVVCHAVWWQTFKFTIVFTKLECKFGNSQNIFFMASSRYTFCRKIIFVFFLYNTKYLKALKLCNGEHSCRRITEKLYFEMGILLFGFVFNEGVINYIDISIRKIA